MRQGGLSICNLVTLNKALLGKWSWRFGVERDSLWNQVIIDKFGVEDGGWCSREVRGAYGVGVWKAIRKDWENIRSRSHLIVENERNVKFWKDLWCEDQALKDVSLTYSDWQLTRINGCAMFGGGRRGGKLESFVFKTL
ncbi:hypothetical protein CK203_032959 [Vitis vinifera]|uniref:Uncharacterized protein n=1 Tax=Vitis vinifera TaxID=29760 RepID=A0A438HVW5_VITVI|nr:hypothetical protein CK203_032959 [Vitis vinifera]